MNAVRKESTSVDFAATNEGPEYVLWDDESEAALIRAWKDDLSQNEIAKQLGVGCTVGMVAGRVRVLREAGQELARRSGSVVAHKRSMKNSTASALPAKLIVDDNDPRTVAILERTDFKNFETLKRHLNLVSVYIRRKEGPLKNWEWEYLHKFLVGRVDDKARANLGYISKEPKGWTGIVPDQKFLDSILRVDPAENQPVEKLPPRSQASRIRTDVVRSTYIA